MAVSDLRQVAANSAADAALEAVLTMVDGAGIDINNFLGGIYNSAYYLLGCVQPIQEEPEPQPAPGAVKRGNPLLDPSYWVRADRLTPTDDQMEESEDGQAA